MCLLRCNKRESARGTSRSSGSNEKLAARLRVCVCVCVCVRVCVRACVQLSSALRRKMTIVPTVPKQVTTKQLNQFASEIYQRDTKQRLRTPLWTGASLLEKCWSIRRSRALSSVFWCSSAAHHRSFGFEREREREREREKEKGAGEGKGEMDVCKHTGGQEA